MYDLPFFFFSSLFSLPFFLSLPPRDPSIFLSLSRTGRKEERRSLQSPSFLRRLLDSKTHTPPSPHVLLLSVSLSFLRCIYTLSIWLAFPRRFLSFFASLSSREVFSFFLSIPRGGVCQRERKRERRPERERLFSSIDLSAT